MLSPFFLRSLWTDGLPRLSVLQWITFVAAAASYAVLCVAFAMSVNYITVADATILTNSQSILLVAVKLCAGQDVLCLEILGVLVAFCGGILCAQESAEGSESPAHGWWSVWGDCLGLISSMGGIGYIVLGKSLRSHMPVIVFMVLNMLTASFIILYVAAIVTFIMKCFIFFYSINQYHSLIVFFAASTCGLQETHFQWIVTSIMACLGTFIHLNLIACHLNS